jgi:hypothetical protein
MRERDGLERDLATELRDRPASIAVGPKREMSIGSRIDCSSRLADWLNPAHLPGEICNRRAHADQFDPDQKSDQP